jgi:hypothetical protein
MSLGVFSIGALPPVSPRRAPIETNALFPDRYQSFGATSFIHLHCRSKLTQEVLSVPSSTTGATKLMHFKGGEI